MWWGGKRLLGGCGIRRRRDSSEDFKNEDLNDSKQLSEKKRYKLRPVIEREAIAWAVGIVSPEEIDKINILKASFLAMHRAIEQLKVRPNIYWSMETVLPLIPIFRIRP